MAISADVQKIWNGLCDEARRHIAEGDLDSMLYPVPSQMDVRAITRQLLGDLVPMRGSLTAEEVFRKDMLAFLLFAQSGKAPAKIAEDSIDLMRMILPEEGARLNDAAAASYLEKTLATVQAVMRADIIRLPMLSYLATYYAAANPETIVNMPAATAFTEHSLYFLDQAAGQPPIGSRASQRAVTQMHKNFDALLAQATQGRARVKPIAEIRAKYDAIYGIAKAPPARPVDRELLADALARLDALEGLGRTKDAIAMQVGLIETNADRAALGLKVEPLSHHMMFAGGPGTGKTTVARLYGDIAKALGLVSKGSFMEVTAADFMGEGVGQTAIKTRELMEKARGGVLFIDEAYSFVAGGGDKGSSFAQDALAEIVAQMENNRGDLIVIFAGYPREMNKLLHANPGMPSRIGTQVPFDDYTPEQLMNIFKKMVAWNDFSADADTRDAARKILDEQFAQKGEAFGNARLVRDLVEGAIRKRALRVEKQRVAGEPFTRKQLTELLPQDLQAVDLNKKIRLAQDPYAGYAGKSGIGFTSHARRAQADPAAQDFIGKGRRNRTADTDASPAPNRSARDRSIVKSAGL